MADIRLEIIYYKVPSDFEMEFNLACSYKYKARTLTCRTHSPQEFVSVLSRAVSRNRVIMAVGKLDGELELCDLIAKATAHPLYAADKTQYNITDTEDFLIPEGAMPLLTSRGCAAGCLLENSAQSIILLTENKALRDAVMKDLVSPYLTDLANHPAQNPEQNSAEQETVITVEEPAVENEDTAEEFQQTEQEAVAVAVAEEAAPQEVIEPDGTEQPQEIAEDIPSDADLATEEEYVIKEDAELSSFADADENITLVLQDEEEIIPQNKPHNKRALHVMLAIVIALVILVAGCFSYFKFFMPIRANAVYTDAITLLGQGNSNLPDSALTKFGALYNKNNAFSGWISIGGTDISLPVMSAANKADGYYNEHLYNGEYNLCGTPHITKQFSSDSYFRNIVIYTEGNWVNNYFSDLYKYSNLEFYKSAPIITFDSLYAESTWKIFSVFTYSGDNKPLDYEKDSFFDDSEFAAHINALAEFSDIVTTVELSKDDEILTLVNKTDDGQTAVVVARKTKLQESVAVDVDGAVKAKNHSGPKGISSTPDVYSSEPVSSNPIQEIIISSSPSSSSKKQTSSKKPASSKPASSKPADSDEPLSDEEIKDNLENIQIPVASTPQSPTTPTTPSSPTSPSDSTWLPLTATRSSDGSKISGSAIDIISQICAAEMGSSYEVEAIKAQAVAAYNWMLCNGGASGKYPNVSMKTASQKIINAVTEVAGKCLYYNGSIAQVYYFAYSAGVTSNIYDIWGSSNTTPYKYLLSVDSSVDKNHKNFQTLRTYKASDIAKWVQESTGIDLNSVADKTKWFNLKYANDGTSPYVATLTFGNSGTVYKGPYLRNTIFTASRVNAAGYGSSYMLKSSAYTITYNTHDDTFTFTVKGYGHGVGMSQYGANQYALSGWKYDRILTHYYPGTVLK